MAYTKMRELHGIDATVIEHTTYKGQELVTFVIQAPKFLDAEIEKHRMFSSNSSSDRAIPFLKMVDKPYFTPTDLRLEQAGMQGFTVADEVLTSEFNWDMSEIRDNVIATLELYPEIHKQHKNRYLLPWSYQTKIITTNVHWFNYFTLLRDAPGADPAIQQLAKAMREAYIWSQPRVIEYGEWHLPFVTKEELNTYTLIDCQHMSVARCARISYNNHDGTDNSFDKDNSLFKHLKDENHCFIDGTEILTDEGYINLKYIEAAVKKNIPVKVANIDENTLEFISWYTLSPKDVYAFKQDDHGAKYVYPSINYGVTSGHKIFGSIVSTSQDRFKYTHSKFKPYEATDNRATKPTKGEQEMLVPKVCNYSVKDIEQETIGKLIGFYIGDGFISSTTTRRFRLVKERKIMYVTKLLDTLGIEYSVEATNTLTSANNTVYQITFDKDNSVEHLLEQCGAHASVKQMPSEVYTNLDLLYGIFDGLKNSDGSVKRHTWDFSTASHILNEQMLSLSGLVGIPTKSVKGHDNINRIMVQTKLYHRLNDSRKPESMVKKSDGNGEIFYCVTVPNHGLLIRTSTGDTAVSGNCTPMEHQATPMKSLFNTNVWEDGITHMSRDGRLHSGNFTGFLQFRQLL